MMRTRHCLPATRVLRATLFAILIATLFGSPAVCADAPSLSGMKLIWPSGSVTFPTGRFGTPDSSTNHAGHKTGYDAGMDFGYMLNDFIGIGIAADYAHFNMDFGSDTTAVLYKTTSASTSAMFGQVWVRAFLPGGYAHWRPYALFGVGLGRPKAKIVSPGHPTVGRFEYTVSTSVGVTGGVGVLIPLSEMLSVSVEPRYRSISTKGSEMEELRVYHNGSFETFTTDQSGNRLRQKSNTTWWELRFGLTVTLQ